MTYKEWYQKHVIDKYGQDQADVMKKQVKNKASDRKQYGAYKKVLGDDLGVKCIISYHEAEKLAQMNAEQKAEYEREKGD